MQPSVPQQQRFHKKTKMAKLTTMTIVQSILILEHTFHNYRQFRVTQWFLFRILGTLKLMSLQDIQWKWRGGFGLHSWNRFPMQYVLSSLDDCMYIVIGFCKPCKGKYRALVSFRTGGTLQSRPDPSLLSQPSAMILADQSQSTSQECSVETSWFPCLG